MGDGKGVRADGRKLELFSWSHGGGGGAASEGAPHCLRGAQ